jgi:tRNA threonylcarbamoyl adenosine modification protein (Sua5/YciO/YrdC/YwlC family)
MDAARPLNQPGKVGVIPTDTVYGLVARAADQAAVAKLYSLKSRENKPGTLIAATIDQLEALGLKRRYLKAVEQFWPGAVSVVIPVSNPELAYLHQGKLSLAVRLPDDAKLQQLLTQTGPLLTTSANQPGQPVSDTIEQAKKVFGSQVDFYQDGGNLAGRQPSTVIRIIDDAIEVLRPGAVKVGDATMDT